jgi:phage terminase small subunit
MADVPPGPPSDVGPPPPISLKKARKKKGKQTRPALIAREPALSPREAQFVTEYLKDLNATAAVQRAGFNFESEGAARVHASTLLRRRHVALALNRAFEARLQRNDVQADQIIASLKAQAFYDIRDVIDNWNGIVTLKDLKALTPEQAAGVESIEMTQFGPKVKFADRFAALTLLMRHAGMLQHGGTRVGIDPQTGRVGVEITEGGEREVLVVYHIPDNGRDARPVEALAVNGHGTAPG